MSADKDPRGRYVIEYQIPNPCVRRENVPVQRMRVTGEHNMKVTRQTLRQSGYTIVSCRRTSWWV